MPTLNIFLRSREPTSALARSGNCNEYEDDPRWLLWIGWKPLEEWLMIRQLGKSKACRMARQLLPISYEQIDANCPREDLDLE
jgi:hypothetical protein